MNPLDADIDPAAVLGERLGVVPAARRERPAIGAENRRHLGVGDARRRVAVVDDAGAQPVALVGQGEEAATAGRPGSRRCRRNRDAARSIRARRGTRARRIAASWFACTERGDQLGVDLDSNRRRRAERTFGRGGNRQQRRDRGKQRDEAPSTGLPRRSEELKSTTLDRIPLTLIHLSRRERACPGLDPGSTVLSKAKRGRVRGCDLPGVGDAPSPGLRARARNPTSPQRGEVKRRRHCAPT